MNDFANVVSTVGFPIAIALACSIALYKVFSVLLNKYMEQLAKVEERNEELGKVIVQITDTNKMLAKDILDKIDKILDKIN